MPTPSHRRNPKRVPIDRRHADRQGVEHFFQAIQSLAAAYENATFAYFAVNRMDEFVLMNGRIFLNIQPSAIPFSHFRSKSVRAGHYRLADLQMDAPTLIECLFSGKLETPHGSLSFPASDDGRYVANYIPFHPDGLQGQRRIRVLRISGGAPQFSHQPDLDWELKAADTPYEGMGELAASYALVAPAAGATVNVEVIAFNVAAIDESRSLIDGESATVQIVLAKGLARDLVTLGYRTPGTVPIRATVLGQNMEWTESDHYQDGVARFSVPNASVVNCTVSYNGVAEQHWWLTDPTQVAEPASSRLRGV
jgi:hypothetical protein